MAIETTGTTETTETAERIETTEKADTRLRCRPCVSVVPVVSKIPVVSIPFSAAGALYPLARASERTTLSIPTGIDDYGLHISFAGEGLCGKHLAILPHRNTY